MSTQPPEPAAEPAEEPGEDYEWHLFPILERLQSMTPQERSELRDAVADWEGPLAERFRQQIADLEAV